MGALLRTGGAWDDATPKVLVVAGDERAILGGRLRVNGVWRPLVGVGGPAASPTNLTAQPASVCEGTTASYRIRFQWTNGDSSAATRLYRNGVYVAQAAAGLSEITVVVGATGSFSGYTVRHLKDTVESGDSNAAGATVTFLDCDDAPKNLTVQDISTCTQRRARISWQNDDPNKPTRLYRDGGQIQQVAAGETFFDDLGVSSGNHTWYAVHVDGFSESNPSNPVTLALQFDCSGGPGGNAPVINSASNNSQCVDLANGVRSWSVDLALLLGDASAETEVWRTYPAGGEVKIGTLAEGVTTYSDTTDFAAIGQYGTYRYRVRHLKNGQTGPWSAYADVLVFDPCGGS